jgi:hypothetical protein
MFQSNPRKLRFGLSVVLLIVVITGAGTRIASLIVQSFAPDELTPTTRYQKPPPPRWTHVSLDGQRVGTIIANALKARLSPHGFSLLHSAHRDRHIGEVFPEADLAAIRSMLEADIATVEHSPLGYDYTDETRSTFQIGGWRYDVLRPEFYGVIALSNGRRYQVRGHFRSSSDGNWSAELDRLLRLLTPAEAGNRSPKDPSVMLVPTIGAARDALVAWVKDFKHWKEANLEDPIRRDVERITPFLESTFELENLSRADIKPRDGFVKLGGWSVACDDARFRRAFRLLTGEIVHIEGRFVADDQGRFGIVITGSSSVVH